jgi:Tfp pilus assembly protein PilX
MTTKMKMNPQNIRNERQQRRVPHAPSLRYLRKEAGSVLITVLISVVILSLVTAAALYSVTPRLGTTYHSSSWNEALNSAEAGADMALQALNNSASNPATAWAAWSPSDSTTFPKTWIPTITPHGGDGNNKVYCKVTVDKSIVDGNGQAWMRVRSLGVAELPPASRTGIEAAVLDSNGAKSHNNVLRKERYNLANDLTGGALNVPQVARTIEALAPPVGAKLFVRGLTTQNEIKLINPFLVDSFDSTDSTKSTNGQYVVGKRQSNGDIASNSSGGVSTLNNCNVWGDASCNTGAMSGASNVHGSQYSNFSTTLPAVPKPSWPFINASPAAITNPGAAVTLTGGPASSPQSYKLTNLSVNNATGKLILASHDLSGTQESYINIWVTGGTTISGTGIIQQNPHVHVTIYSEGSIVIGGSGWDNQTHLAANLLAFGVTPATYSTKDFRVDAGTFIGVFNGGNTFDLTIEFGATFIGAAVGREADYSGAGAFHYDESLSNLSSTGGPTTYQYASWVEDIR